MKLTGARAKTCTGGDAVLRSGLRPLPNPNTCEPLGWRAVTAVVPFNTNSDVYLNVTRGLPDLNLKQLSTTDLLALASMKNAAKCDK